MRKFIINTHRILGAILSILFVAWFISGLVLIYHHFPRYSHQEQMQQLQSINGTNLPQIDSLGQLIKTMGGDSLKTERLRIQGSEIGGASPLIVISPAKGNDIKMDLRGSKPEPIVVNYSYLEQVAARWNSKVIAVDTLNKLDQWTPFGNLKDDLPFYRIRLSGDEDRRVYISSHTGKILQESTYKERVWAWLGAIPHWVYFTFLRQHREAWIWTIIILGALGTLMTITGFYLGIEIYYKNRKRAKASRLYSPFRKKRYQWHHFFGTVGGILIILWVFTGMMSVIHFSDNKSKEFKTEKLSGNTLSLDSYHTDLNALLKMIPDVKSINFTGLGDVPVIEVMTPQQDYYFDGNSSIPNRLNLSSEIILQEAQKVFGSKYKYDYRVMDKYDAYYISHSGKLSLPVVRVSVNTPDKHTLYVNPETAQCRIIDNAAREDAWRFRKFHSLNFSFLANHPVIWTIVMWLFMIIGLVASATGLWLSIDYIKRLVRRRCHRN
ncbi:PepSY-associated TM helix domain-containing protein [Porphyromonas pogonae]|uniref:PepSY-associated TM helix domain-containing protein n=1 Tax=Porphyromonas pogonae TaxID=867595 RepID=UPI002E75BB7B|nr:PepSY-associated TM helix domain-containing protein [Porphyromonas pogonae]